MRNPLIGSAYSEKPSNQESSSESSISDVDELLSLVKETEAAKDIYRNIEVLGAASKSDYGRIRGELKDATGVNLNQLDAAVREAR